MAASVIKDALPSTCEVTIPPANAAVEDVLGKRWWQLTDSRPPAAVVVPSSEDDVVAAVKLAAAQGLKVVPAGGSLSAFVVVDGETLYLDLHKLKGVQVDEKAKTVTVGGGTVWKDVMGAVTEKGFYTTWVGYSNVGVVGSILGGGLNPFIGQHGFSCDQVVGARMVTASGEVLTLSDDGPSSCAPPSDEQRLFNLLCGGRVNLGVVTSITIRIHPQSILALEEGNKVVTYSAVFAQPSFSYATDLFASFTQRGLDDRMDFFCGLASAPPSMDRLAGSPVLSIAGRFMGDRASASAVLAPLLSDEVRGRAVFVGLDASPIERINGRADAAFADKAGGHSDIFNCLTRELSAEALSAAVDRWLQLRTSPATRAAAEAGRFVTGIAAYSNRAVLGEDPKGRKGFSRRDRRFMGQIIMLGLRGAEEIEAGARYGREMVDILRRVDRANGVEDAAFGNNSRAATDLREVHTAEKLEEVKAVRAIWDPKGVFWHPAVDSRL